ncbi:MAG: methylmalonyl-CoA epimerase [Bacteroidota bacterium]
MSAPTRLDGVTLDHIGIATLNAGTLAAHLHAVLGLPTLGHGTAPADGVAATLLSTASDASPVAAPRLELLAPTSTASPIATFLDRRGPGLHHLAFRVPDLDAALARLQADGVPLLDHVPRAGLGGKRIAFLHPKACGGVLVELVEAA